MTIITRRLHLRPAQPSDAPALVQSLNDWSIAQWLQRPPFPYTDAGASRFVAWSIEAQDAPDTFVLVIADRADDRLLGVISILDEGDGREVGYWLAHHATGQGYISEALDALLRQVRTWAPAKPVFAIADPDNERSQAVLRRCSFQLLRQERRSTLSRRGSYEHLYFEWRPDDLGPSLRSG